MDKIQTFDATIQNVSSAIQWEDGVFKKRQLEYKTDAAFQRDLAAKKISKYSIVYIRDTKSIYKNGIYYTEADVDITTIVDRIEQNANTENATPELDYLLLESYVTNRVKVYSIKDNEIFDIELQGGNTNVTVIKHIPTQTGITYNIYIIDKATKTVQGITHEFLNKENTVDSLLTNYVISESYTEIQPTDSIKTAIGKLEGSLGAINQILDEILLGSDQETFDYITELNNKLIELNGEE